ncbi:MAG: matrixin family metalloprotease, partial [Planctomycetota bacterium]
MVRTRPGLPPRRRRPARTTQQQNRKQRTASRPRLEALEKRELLAGDLGTDWQPRGVFAPGTSGDTFNAFNGTGGDGSGDDSGSGDPSAILLGSRWSETALGAGPNLGDTATVTWSIVRDGTQILNANQSNFGTSDLVAFMDGIYGGAGVGVIDEKPWFRLFESIFEGYSETTGLNFVYEPNDDGVPMVRTDAIGVDGVRGDIRIAGDRIDGNGNVLAFNYEPANGGAIGLAGDMVIDTEDNFYANNADGPNGENRGLVNVLAHEAGHGIGLAHVLPVDGTKLMEPFINLGFLTVQEDDLWNTHILYGDYAEPNDTTTTAFDFGNLNAEVVDQVGLSIDDGATDRDVFSFSISSGTDISLSITPTGSQYQAGPQFGGPDVPVDRLREGDLGFRILDPFGVELIRVDEGAAGVAEIIDEFSLAADGTYFIEVFGTGNTQLYDFNLSVGETSDFARDTDSLRLISVTPNADEVLRRDALNLRESAPTELTLRFTGEQGIDPETIADGVRLRRAGNDGRTGTADDLLITPGFVGLGDNDRTIIMRFAEPLQDDRYRLEVFGEEPDALTLGGDAPMALRMTNGDAFAPRTRGTDRDTIDFELELGARINAIVPQPITRDASGDLDHHRERIDVYFDDDDLFAGGGTASLVDPSFYQLIRTADTTENTDDVSYLPISVTPVQFETQTLPDPITGAPVDIQVKVNRVQLEFAADLEDLAGTGAFRLKIGDSLPVAVTTTPPQETDLGLVADAASTFAAAQQITDFGNFASVRLSQSIVDTGLPFDYPGSNLGPGHRDQRDQNHFFEVGTDVDGQIQQLTYTFSLDQAYGADFNGTPLFTSINPTQIRRVREVFELYGELLGVDFVETSGAGDITVVLGDLAALGQTSGAGGLLGFSSAIPGALAIIDSAESWYDGYGTLAGQPSFFEVALHEIGHTIGLGSTFELPGGTIMGNEPVYAGGTDEFQYPGDHDVLHGRHLYRPDNRDVDIYRITAPEDGVLVAETFAERKQGSSTLDTYMQLFRETSEGPELVASNDDLFGNDSSITFDLESGESYFVAVTASGNEDFDGNVDGTGSGGSSQGDYQLLLNFTPAATNQILDAAGTPIDGDGDGVAGGAFDFWFRAAEASDTLYVDASNVQPGDGSLDNPYQTIASAMAAVAPGQIVRVVGNAGADGVVGLPQTNFANAEDNFAYEIGRIESLNRTLDDGENLVVPKDVTVMIDAGSVLKFLGSRIAVGSGQSGVDASGGALQILGVPHLPVFMTSLNDSQFGLESNPLQVAPSPADWGGIDIRNASDRDEGRLELEREGIFLNYVAGADIRYGGGSVRIDGQLTPIAPLRLDAARPTLINNQISVSADSAISADPDSFEETRFNDLRYQRDVAFVPDYDRVGPVMYGNTLTDNTINGVLVRLDVLPSGGREKLRTSARFDDTDIVHVLGNNLIIEGNPSGLSLAEVPNPLTLTQIAPTNVGTGSLPAGSYEYQLAFIDRFGVETLPTAATVAISVPADSDIELTDLPVATGDFVSRRLYRRQGGVGAFELVEELNRSDTSHVDGLLTPRPINPIAASEFTAKPDARLVIDAGLVIKSDSLHIETEFGGNLIAEGDNGLPVVFTSRFDDRYGAAGSFDTTSDGESQGAPGDWAGIFANPFSRVSIDNAVIAFGGGESTVGGSSVGFNAVGFLQSDVRITNTRFESNTTGVAGSQENRVGRGPNEPAVIFGVASQPILVGNSFFGTDGDDTAAISLNANAFIDQAVRDAGRQTGGVDLVDVRPGNHGPLIEDNRISEGGVAGVRIRSEILNTAVALDDTDIVHVVDGDLRVVDLHTVGGLRLQSRGDESLVVKFTDGSGLTADGRALDIDDRIGGSLHVIGQPGFPVVLTSLSDDTVGSGFTPSGAALLDTGGDGPTAGAPGDWAGVRLFEFSNDRNVATVVEAEGSLEARGDSNAISPQPLGTLATGEKASDDNLRLGFTVHGRIAQPEDTDSYSFTAKAGTTVWFDIDQTDAALDTVIELVDGAGQLIARSDDSDAEANQANPAVDFVDGAIARPMPQGVFAQRNAVSGSIHDYGTINPLDAGMRVELPGALGEDREFFIRVRGKDSSTGSYRLQLRLRELDEFGGSTVRLSEIRFASAGITVSGLPLHSPLTGEASVIAGNEDLAIDLGNLANTDRAALSIAGNITPGSPANIYDFRLERDSIEAGGDDTLIPLSFDIDYADNVGRPDTSILLYYAGVDGTDPPRLVMIGRDSNVSADQSGPLSGNDLTDLSRGSSGSQDAFLGTVELPAGEYVAVVVSDALIPSDLLQYFEATAANPNIRLEPINGFARIAEDRFGDPIVRPTTINPTPQGVAFTGDENAVPFAFGDSNMFVLRGTATGSRFDIHNPQIGDLEATVTAEYGTRLSAVTDLPNNTFLASDNLQIGEELNDANLQQMFILDDQGNITAAGDHGLNTFIAVGDQIEQHDIGVQIRAMTHFYRDPGVFNLDRMVGVGGRFGGAQYFNQAILGPDDAIIGNNPFQPAQNYLYRLNPATGEVINSATREREGAERTFGAGTQLVEMARIALPDPTNPGFEDDFLVTGITDFGNDFYAVTNEGHLIRVPIGSVPDVSGAVRGDAPTVGELVRVIEDEDGNPIPLTAIARGPERIETYGDALFLMTAGGDMIAVDTFGTRLDILGFAESEIDVDGGGVIGFAFSQLDVNLWHRTDVDGDVAGHGTSETLDESRLAADGQNSFRFGFDDPDGQLGIANAAIPTEALDTFNFPGGTQGGVESYALDLSGYAADDLPTMYFSYLLDTEDANSLIDSAATSRDSFRVYVNSEQNRDWTLVATNNDPRGFVDNDLLDSEDEIDVTINGFVNPDGRAQMVQQLFDDGQWRQARVTLAPWAGHNDVRIRFDFNTAGEVEFNALELRAAEPSVILDSGQFGFTIAPDGLGQIQFEFDLGLVMQLPGGAAIPN